MNAELIAKLVPAELRNGYTFNRYGIVTSPGKFEGETIATLYYYDAFLNGEGAVFEVTEEERKAFDISEETKFVYLHESNDGFVSLEYHDTREEAEESQLVDDCNFGEDF